MTEFLEKSKIKELTFVPFWTCLTPLMTALTYVFSETYYENFMALDYDLETFTVADGGTVGITWTCPKGSKSGRPTE